MHNFVHLAQRRSQEFFLNPISGGGRAPAPAAPLIETVRHVSREASSHVELFYRLTSWSSMRKCDTRHQHGTYFLIKLLLTTRIKKQHRLIEYQLRLG